MFFKYCTSLVLESPFPVQKLRLSFCDFATSLYVFHFPLFPTNNPKYILTPSKMLSLYSQTLYLYMPLFPECTPKACRRTFSRWWSACMRDFSRMLSAFFFASKKTVEMLLVGKKGIYVSADPGLTGRARSEAFLAPCSSPV